MRFNEIEESTQRETLRRIYADDIDWQRDNFVKVNAEIRRVVLLLNSGTAAALMTYMGSSMAIRAAGVAWLTLGLFGAGIFCLLVSYALGFHMLKWHLSKTDANLILTLRSELEIEEYERRRVEVPRWFKRLGNASLAATYAAVVLWIAGVCTAIIYLRPDTPIAGPWGV
jgi:hypothetical protein